MTDRMRCLPIFVASLWACSVWAEPIPVVVRDVPAVQSFVVLPANESAVQTQFAEKLEALLLEFGLRVFRRPAMKHVEETREDSAVPVDGAADVAVASRTKTESFYEFDAITAEYVLFAFQQVGGPGRIEIVRRSDRELLAAFTTSRGVLTGQTKDRFAAALYALGMLKAAPDKAPLPAHRFVPRRDVGERPVFVVIPAQRVAEQLDLVDDVQRLLQLLGVRVEVAPGSKTVVEKKSVGLLTADANRPLDGQHRSRTETYSSIDLTGIDFVIETNAERGKRVRIFKGSSNELIGALDLSGRNREADEWYGQAALAGGIGNAELSGPTRRNLRNLRFKLEKLGAVPALDRKR